MTKSLCEVISAALVLEGRVVKYEYCLESRGSGRSSNLLYVGVVLESLVVE